MIILLTAPHTIGDPPKCQATHPHLQSMVPHVPKRVVDASCLAGLSGTSGAYAHVNICLSGYVHTNITAIMTMNQNTNVH